MCCYELALLIFSAAVAQEDAFIIRVGFVNEAGVSRLTHSKQIARLTY